MSDREVIDVLVVGAGPAGLAAGIYAARAGLTVVLLEESSVGGQLASIDDLENYPGFAEGINGFDAAFALKAQAERFGASIVSDKATSLSLHEEGEGPARFSVAGLHDAYSARSVVVATGAKPVPLPLPEAEGLVGGGVSYCATCDGNFFRGKDVAVVGGGDSAVADAVYLSRVANAVHLIHRRDELRASSWNVQRMERLGNVAVHWSSVVKRIDSEEGRVNGVVVENVATGKAESIPVQGLFVAIGTRPDTEWLSGLVDLDDQGYVVAREGGATSVPGIFTAGDVRTTPLRQVVTAVADGALAAESAASFLASC